MIKTIAYAVLLLILVGCGQVAEQAKEQNMGQNIYLVEITAYDPGIAGTKVLRYCTGAGYTTGPADTPTNTYYEPRVIQPGTIKQSMFDDGTTGGASKTGYGEIVLSNPDGELDGVLDYGLDGQQVVVRAGQPGAPYPSGFATVLTGTMEQPVGGDKLSIRIRDRQAELNVPIQPEKYLGNNALPLGLEGVDDLKGKPKPLLFGSRKNITPVLVNTSKLIYQVNDGGVDVETTPNDFSGFNVGSGTTRNGDTFTFAVGSFNQKLAASGAGWDAYRTYTGLSNGDLYEWQAEVNPSATTNLIVTADNNAIWDSASYGVNYTNLPAGIWTTLTIPFSADTTGAANIHLGAIGQTELADTVQSAATIQFRNMRLLHKTGSRIDPVGAAYDQGVALTQGADYTAIRDMLANAPAAGTYRVWPAGGYFRLGSSPAGQVTADATQGAAPADRTCAQLCRQMVLRRLTAADLIEQGFIDLDKANSAEVGIYIDAEMTISAALDVLCRSVGAWYGFDNLGKFRIQRLEIPSGNPITTLTNAEGLTVERLATNDAGRGVPAYRVILDYDQNCTVQTSGLAGSVPLDRRNWLKDPYRTVKSEDLSVQTKHLLAPELHFTTNLADSAAAQAEADRLMPMYSTRRDLMAVTCSVDAIQYPEGGWWDDGAISQLPASRTHHTVVIHNNYLYVIGGMADDGSLYSSVVRLDLTNPTASWDDVGVTDLPSPRFRHAAVVHGNFLYVIGGSTVAGPTNSVIRLDLTNPAGNWDDIGVTDLPTTRTYLNAVTYNDYLYITGGDTGSPTSPVLRLDLNNPSGAWNDIGVQDTPVGRIRAGAVVYNGYLYVVGGVVGTSKINSVIRLNLDNPIVGWDDIGVTDLPNVRSDAPTVVRNGYLYVIGGRNAYGAESSVLRLDLNNPAGSWDDAVVAHLPDVRGYAKGVVSGDGNIIIVGGYASTPQANTYIYRFNSATDLSRLWDLGRVVMLKIPRYGFDLGKLFRLIGTEIDYALNKIKLTLWG